MDASTFPQGVHRKDAKEPQALRGGTGTKDCHQRAGTSRRAFEAVTGALEASTAGRARVGRARENWSQLELVAVLSAWVG